MSAKKKLYCQKCDREFKHAKDIWNGRCPQCAIKPDNYPITISINRLKSAWPKTKSSSTTGNRAWSSLAYQCLLVSRDCSQCPINLIYGWEYPEGNCKMPEAVQRLLDDGIEPARFNANKLHRELL